MRVRIVVAIGVLAAVLIGVTSAGAAVGGRQATQRGAHPYKLDLSSMSKIRSYLRSIGVDPKSVVIQRGRRNYAGPNCPGKGWNCTRATRVVQIASSSGQNQFNCSPAASGTSPGTNTCVIVQPGPSGNNQAECDESDTTEPISTESCDITQTGNQNMAIVHQSIAQSTSPTQTAEQFARVMQTGTSKNDSEIYQAVTQATGSTMAGAQAQDVHQAAIVRQFVNGSENFSHVHQTQDQRETGSAVTQTQNTNAPTFAPVTSCVVPKPSVPNQCANVCQTSATSPSCPGTPTVAVDNESHLHQMIAETESSNAATPDQTQGNRTMGQGGEIHMENPVGAGLNHNHVVQSLGQREVAPSGVAGFHQNQLTDPGCCGVSTVGGSDNLEDVNQSTTMSASAPDAVQDAELLGHEQEASAPALASVASAPTTTSNDQCRIDQFGRTNSGGDHFSLSGTDLPTGCEPPGPTLNTECVNTANTEGQTQSCEPVCDQFCTDGVPVVGGLLPTYGQAISMPSFIEPSSYVPFGS